MEWGHAPLSCACILRHQDNGNHRELARLIRETQGFSEDMGWSVKYM